MACSHIESVPSSFLFCDNEESSKTDPSCLSTFHLLPRDIIVCFSEPIGLYVLLNPPVLPHDIEPRRWRVRNASGREKLLAGVGSCDGTRPRGELEAAAVGGCSSYFYYPTLHLRLALQPEDQQHVLYSSVCHGRCGFSKCGVSRLISEETAFKRSDVS